MLPVSPHSAPPHSVQTPHSVQLHSGMSQVPCSSSFGTGHPKLPSSCNGKKSSNNLFNFWLGKSVYLISSFRDHTHNQNTLAVVFPQNASSLCLSLPLPLIFCINFWKFCDRTFVYCVAPFLILYQLFEVASSRRNKGDEFESSRSVSKLVLKIELAYFSYDHTSQAIFRLLTAGIQSRVLVLVPGPPQSSPEQMLHSPHSVNWHSGMSQVPCSSSFGTGHPKLPSSCNGWKTLNAQFYFWLAKSVYWISSIPDHTGKPCLNYLPQEYSHESWHWCQHLHKVDLSKCSNLPTQ